MVDVHLRYVNEVKDRKGKKRYYFRRHGKGHRLPDDPKSPQFVAEHQRLMLETEQDALPRRVAPAKGTFHALALAYYASPNFKGRSTGTKKTYRAIIDAFCTTYGARPVDQMRRSHITKLLGGMDDRPGAANNLARVLKVLLSFAVDQEIIPTNPIVGVRLYKGKEIHTWTEEEIAKYEEHWKLGTRERLAFDALLYTGQRVSDVCRMSLPDASGKIRITQQKTGTQLIISVHPNLQKSIAACPSKQLTILPSRTGAPITANRLSILMYKAIDEAGLPDHCVAHGLRKAFTRRLAESGSTGKEIMASTGHLTSREVDRYSRAAEQEKLNESAMRKQIANT